MKKLAICGALLCLLLGTGGQAQAATCDTELTVPLETQKHNRPGAVRQLNSIDTSQFEGATAIATSKNQDSVHPGNNLLIDTGVDSAGLYNMEARPYIERESERFTLGSTLTVSIEFGRDGVFSGGSAVTVCVDEQPPATTTPPTTVPPTTTPETTVPSTGPPVTTAPSTDPPSTDPPSTDPPTTTVPSTDPPTTDPPVDCHPAYPTECIPPPPPDLDCEDIDHRNFPAKPSDPHNLDGNDDMVACEEELVPPESEEKPPPTSEGAPPSSEAPPGSVPANQELPETGVEMNVVLAAAIVLIVGGLAFLLVVRRSE